MDIDRTQLTVGMPVVGSDGTIIGRVKAVRGDDFQIDRPLQMDVLLPLSMVKVAGDELAVLTFPASQVDDHALAHDAAQDEPAA